MRKSTKRLFARAALMKITILCNLQLFSLQHKLLSYSHDLSPCSLCSPKCTSTHGMNGVFVCRIVDRIMNVNCEWAYSSMWVCDTFHGFLAAKSGWIQLKAVRGVSFQCTNPNRRESGRNAFFFRFPWFRFYSSPFLDVFSLFFFLIFLLLFSTSFFVVPVPSFLLRLLFAFFHSVRLRFISPPLWIRTSNRRIIMTTNTASTARERCYARRCADVLYAFFTVWLWMPCWVLRNCNGTQRNGNSNTKKSKWFVSAPTDRRRFTD